MILVIILLWMFHAPLLTAIADYLLFNDPLVQSDVVIALSGDATGGRVKEAVEVLKQGYADKLIVIGGRLQWNTYECDIMKAHAVHLGVPESSVFPIRIGMSTYTQANKIVDEMKKRNFKSAIIVTSDFHGRRVKYMFGKAFEHAGLNLGVHTSTKIKPSSASWWRNPELTETIFYEYTKLFWYWVKY